MKVDSVMIDLETMGTGPNAAVVQVGAVGFNLATGEVARRGGRPPTWHAAIHTRTCSCVGWLRATGGCTSPSTKRTALPYWTRRVEPN